MIAYSSLTIYLDKASEETAVALARAILRMDGVIGAEAKADSPVPHALDYVVDYDYHQQEWYIWTPDENGGIIGIGKSEQEAKADAVKSMELLIARLGGGK